MHNIEIAKTFARLMAPAYMGNAVGFLVDAGMSTNEAARYVLAVLRARRG